VSKDKKVTVLDSGGSLHSPASIAFGVGDDAEVLYMTKFALLSAQGGGTPRPGVLRKDIDIKGIPLP